MNKSLILALYLCWIYFSAICFLKGLILIPVKSVLYCYSSFNIVPTLS